MLPGLKGLRIDYIVKNLFSKSVPRRIKKLLEAEREKRLTYKDRSKEKLSHTTEIKSELSSAKESLSKQLEKLTEKNNELILFD